MLLRFFQIPKAVAGVVTLALLLQAGGVGCALACARAASITNQQECHAAISNDAPAARVSDAAISTEHACCHSSRGVRLEAGSATHANPFHQAAKFMPCCLLAGQIVMQAVKRQTTAGKTFVLAREPVSTPLNLDFRVAPFTGRARLPDRGGTYLRCRVLLI